MDQPKEDGEAGHPFRVHTRGGRSIAVDRAPDDAEQKQAARDVEQQIQNVIADRLVRPLRVAALIDPKSVIDRVVDGEAEVHERPAGDRRLSGREKRRGRQRPNRLVLLNRRQVVELEWSANGRRIRRDGGDEKYGEPAESGWVTRAHAVA